MKPARKVAIIGFGLEGRALFFYLKKEGSFDITILDKNLKIKLPRGAKSTLGRNYLAGLKNFDIIFRSPGVPFNLKEIGKVKNRVSSLSKLFFESARGIIVGITGSAGKTTTATLLYKMLKRAGRDAYLVGNIGINSLGVLRKLSPRSVTVMELSSFQLQDLKHSPHIAVILDIYEEHLDKHKSFQEYLGAKANIARFQRKSDYVIYSAENKFSKRLAFKSRGRKIPFAGSDIAKLVSGGIKLRGEHNQKNAAAASLVARLLGVPRGIISKVAASFTGLEHRLEFVRKLRGVEFYNDSKATNIGSAIAGIDAFRENKIVLVGGYNKNLNFRRLAKRLAAPDVSFVVLFGKAGGEILRQLKKLRVKNFKQFRTLHPAVNFAKRIARRGEVVLLSPATASFDEFEDYKERGKMFKKIVVQFQ
ncbi:MAG: UDP-N-acetylmuramoyl-L-alanine--D-glutamate ligase [bacterium]|nr:UDP-N-acetylmuramoyl-L-alanine--D-glutamate ligase [bacterium]